MPQERQNIIRYWLENLRAKQGEALHNIHFLEGQPISEYGTARHGHPPPATSPHPSCATSHPPRVPGVTNRVTAGTRCAHRAVARVGHRAPIFLHHPKPTLPVIPTPNLAVPGLAGDTFWGPGVRGGTAASPRLTPCPRGAVPELAARGVIQQVFPLHEQRILKRLMKSWVQAICEAQPLGEAPAEGPGVGYGGPGPAHRPPGPRR